MIGCAELLRVVPPGAENVIGATRAGSVACRNETMAAIFKRQSKNPHEQSRSENGNCLAFSQAVVTNKSLSA